MTKAKKKSARRKIPRSKARSITPSDNCVRIDLRLGQDVWRQLTNAACKSGRNLHDEIAYRLRTSLNGDDITLQRLEQLRSAILRNVLE